MELIAYLEQNYFDYAMTAKLATDIETRDLALTHAQIYQNLLNKIKGGFIYVEDVPSTSLSHNRSKAIAG